MRTTLDIDDEILAAAKELARREHKTTGRIISELARRALMQPMAATEIQEEPEAFFGFRPVASRGGVVTNERINRLRDEEGV